MKTPAIVRAMEVVEGAHVLDATIDDVNGLASKAFQGRGGRVRDILHGEPLGHPAHPVAVLVPAGAWISAAVLDFMPGQSRAARALVGFGILGAIPAAASGIADWSLLKRKQQRVGIVHWAANLTAVALYSASYLQRRRGKELSGKILGLAGLGVVSASGYLGGHLAYRLGANVLKIDDLDFADATAAQIPLEWNTLGLVDSYQDHKLSPTELDGSKLVVYRDGLDLQVLVGTCSFCDDDLDLESSSETEGRSALECPQDGSRFDLATGAVTRGPAVAPIGRFETMVSTGMVEVRRAQS